MPDADNEPDVDHEISEPALFRFLVNEENLKQLDEGVAETTQMRGILKDMEKDSKIVEFKTHQISTDIERFKISRFHRLQDDK